MYVFLIQRARLLFKESVYKTLQFLIVKSSFQWEKIQSVFSMDQFSTVEIYKDPRKASCEINSNDSELISFKGKIP